MIATVIEMGKMGKPELEHLPISLLHLAGAFRCCIHALEPTKTKANSFETLAKLPADVESVEHVLLAEVATVHAASKIQSLWRKAKVVVHLLRVIKPPRDHRKLGPLRHHPSSTETGVLTLCNDLTRTKKVQRKPQACAVQVRSLQSDSATRVPDAPGAEGQPGSLEGCVSRAVPSFATFADFAAAVTTFDHERALEPSAFDSGELGTWKALTELLMARPVIGVVRGLHSPPSRPDLSRLTDARIATRWAATHRRNRLSHVSIWARSLQWPDTTCSLVVAGPWREGP